MNRIQKRFQDLKKEGRGAFIPYLEAYDPDAETSFELLKNMPASGADLIEVGVPFSDPSADGPTIQHAAQRALKAGATLKKVLSLIAKFRETDQTTPIILMGYFNPIDRYDVEKFCHDAAQSGIDGLIIVDLPPEEYEVILPYLHKYKLQIITLTTPNTPEERLQKILKKATGFVYYVSIIGITGTRTSDKITLENAITRIRKFTTLPIVTGFGITTTEHAKTAATLSDGAVIASAIIRKMAETLDDGKATKETIPTVLEKIKEFSLAIRTQ